MRVTGFVLNERGISFEFSRFHQPAEYFARRFVVNNGPFPMAASDPASLQCDFGRRGGRSSLPVAQAWALMQVLLMI